MTYPLTTLAPSISSTGISAPTYDDILASLKVSAGLIFGVDVYLEPDSQDGQLLAIFAKAIYDSNQATIAAWQSFRPSMAQGEGLSSVVKINHIARRVATKSQANVTLTGVAGTVINNGVLADTTGNLWDLPASVTISVAGTVVVTATAQQSGAIQAAARTITNLNTPTAGWQSASNPLAAIPGQPIESDGELRARQEISPALNASNVLAALQAALSSLVGVVYAIVYENDTGITDAEGIPAHSIAVVVQGGDVDEIAQTIFDKKAPGVSTYGDLTVVVTDLTGPRDINFFQPTEVPLKVGISLSVNAGYTTAVGNAIRLAVADAINGLSIGEDLVVSRLYGPALLMGDQYAETYKITVLQAALHPAGTLDTTDVVMTFAQKATCDPANVTITLV